MSGDMKQFRDAVILTVAITGLALVFKLAQRLDPRFRKTAGNLQAVYQFRSGGSARRIKFDHGKISSGGYNNNAPDFEIKFVDLPGALSYMAKYPNDPLTLLMENKIEQTGNLYFLYMFGYLCGLVEDYFRGITRREKAAGAAGAKPEEPSCSSQQ